MMEESSSESESSTSTASPKRGKRKITRRVRKKPTPNFQRCLFCLGSCTLSWGTSEGKQKEDSEGDADKLEGKDGGETLNIPGAGKSVLLRKHLEQTFILRKLLEVPSNWCHETLQRHTEKVLQKDNQVEDDKEKEERQARRKEEDEEEMNGDLNLWFNLCVKCYKGLVQPGWEIYQKMIALEEQLIKIKTTVKDTMKEKILQNKRNRKWSGLTGNGMDVLVRKWVFPDLNTIKAEENGVKKMKEIPKPPIRPRPSYKKEEPSVALDDSDPDDDFNDNDDPVQDQDFPSPCPSPPSPSSPMPPSPTPVTPNKSISKSKPSRNRKKDTRKRIRIRKPRRKFEDLKKFKCVHCSSYFLKYEDLTKHLTLHEEPEKYHVCPQCTFPAETSIALELHIKNRHERRKVRKCTWEGCTFTCTSYVKLEKHLNVVHQEEAGTVEAFNCEKCGRTFSHRFALVIHQKKTHPELFGAELEEPVECGECGLKFISKILLGYHVENVHRFEGTVGLQCEECGKSFSDKSKLDRHKITHINETKRDFVCDICGVDYAYKSLLDEHYRKVHARGKGKIEVGDVAPEMLFRCKFCEVTSPFKVAIDRHMKEHKEGMGHKCKKCGKCYMNVQGLTRHLKVNHPRKKITVKCPWCNKGFPCREYMKVHERLYCKLKGVSGGDGGGGGGDQELGNAVNREIELLNLC